MILQFLNLFGDVQSIKKAEDRHAKLFISHKSTSELKKRLADDYLASEKAKMAKSYPSVASPAQSLMGAYPTGQNQWAASYGLQPQAWPPVAQGQGQQQWAPGYTQSVKALLSCTFLFFHMNICHAVCLKITLIFPRCILIYWSRRNYFFIYCHHHNLTVTIISNHTPPTNKTIQKERKRTVSLVLRIGNCGC